MLVNLRDESIVASRVKHADTFAGRLRGLMFSKEFPAGIDALILTPCNAVHTFFMRYHLDVLFLDGNLKVLYIIHKMKPGRFSPVVKEARYVVEMAVGNAVRCGVQVGDSLSLQEERKAV